jgi:hypothetical protein
MSGFFRATRVVRARKVVVVLASVLASTLTVCRPAMADSATDQQQTADAPLPLMPIAALGRALTFVFKATVSGTQSALALPDDAASAPELSVVSPEAASSQRVSPSKVANTAPAIPVLNAPKDAPLVLTPTSVVIARPPRTSATHAPTASKKIVSTALPARILPQAAAPATTPDRPRVAALPTSGKAKPAHVAPAQVAPVQAAKTERPIPRPQTRPANIVPQITTVSVQKPAGAAVEPAPVDSMAIIAPTPAPNTAAVVVEPSLLAPSELLGVGAHLASYRNLAESVAGWTTLTDKSSLLRDGMQPLLVQHVLAGNSVTMYRLYARPFASIEQARAFCRKAMASGLNYCQAHQIQGAAEPWPNS